MESNGDYGVSVGLVVMAGAEHMSDIFWPFDRPLVISSRLSMSAPDQVAVPACLPPGQQPAVCLALFS